MSHCTLSTFSPSHYCRVGLLGRSCPVWLTSYLVSSTRSSVTFQLCYRQLRIISPLCSVLPKSKNTDSMCHLCTTLQLLVWSLFRSCDEDNFLPLLSYILKNGNVTVYKWKHGIEPQTSIPHSTPHSTTVQIANDTIDIDWGEGPGETVNLQVVLMTSLWCNVQPSYT